jgi:hypothetical protein
VAATVVLMREDVVARDLLLRLSGEVCGPDVILDLVKELLVPRERRRGACASGARAG